MRISLSQVIAILLAVGVFTGLVFMRSKPVIKEKDKESLENSPLTEEAVLVEARNRLDTSQLKYLTELERHRAEAATISLAKEADVLKLMSQAWNGWQNFMVGGIYAEKVAILMDEAQAWAIAGTTYGIGFRRSKDAKHKTFSAEKAIASFQKAQELAPDEEEHWINEAVMYIDLSQVDRSIMPMTGIRKLQNLDTQFPNNVKVNIALARLSFDVSKDYGKAIPRFEKVLAIYDTAAVDSSVLLEVNYSLSKCYAQQSDTSLAMDHLENCLELTRDSAILAAILSEKKNLEVSN